MKSKVRSSKKDGLHGYSIFILHIVKNSDIIKIDSDNQATEDRTHYLVRNYYKRKPVIDSLNSTRSSILCQTSEI